MAHSSPLDRQNQASARFAKAASSGNWQQAILALDELIAITPPNASLHYNRALALRLAGRAVEGLAAAQAALALDPANAKALFEIGACALEAGQAEVSIKASETYLTLNPTDPDARLNAARAALMLDDVPTALSHLDAVASEQREEAHRLCRGEALRNLKRFDEAEAEWRALPPSAAPLVLSLRSKGAVGRLPLQPSRIGHDPRR